MKFCEGRFEFQFPNALTGFRFDEPDRNLSTFHGLSHCMKAVDFVVELEHRYLFIEVKDMFDPDSYQNSDAFNHLKSVLIKKYRDSFLYRWAEEKLDKPVTYLCLIELENPIINQLTREMQIHLPTSVPKNSRWLKPIAAHCQILNSERWNHNFPAWPLRLRMNA